MQFSLNEKLNIYNCFIHNNRSVALALREYKILYPNRRLPGRKIFAKLDTNLQVHGSLVVDHRSKGRHITDEEAQLQVLLYFMEFPTKSVRDAERDLRISRSSIHECLKINNFKPYKFLPVQELNQADFNARLNFCNIMMDRHFESNFFDNVLWTDEASFSTSGMFNRKNTHYWDCSNLRKIIAIKKTGKKNGERLVWCLQKSCHRTNFLQPQLKQSIIYPKTARSSATSA